MQLFAWNWCSDMVQNCSSIQSAEFHIYASVMLYPLLLQCQLLKLTDSSISKEYACDTGDPGLIPGLGRSPGEGKLPWSYPLQYSGLENSWTIQSMGLQSVRHDWATSTFFHFKIIISCLPFRRIPWHLPSGWVKNLFPIFPKYLVIFLLFYSPYSINSYLFKYKYVSS